LGTDYIDLYQIHRFDPETPIEETMEALHDVVKAGKVRYLGASSMWAWQFASMQHAADLHGWTRFVSMQDQYSLLAREEEREMLPLLAHQGVGSIPWSPLAGGKVARPWGDTSTQRSSENRQTDQHGTPLFLESDKGIVDAVEGIAAARGVPMAQIGLTWVLRNPVVSARSRLRKPQHLSDAVAALSIEPPTARSPRWRSTASSPSHSMTGGGRLGDTHPGSPVDAAVPAAGRRRLHVHVDVQVDPDPAAVRQAAGGRSSRSAG
jgi:aryl-alcohol dehydrogenase-like predicted oxidoreductase